MLEYSMVLGNRMSGMWDELGPLLDSIRGSAYFWPAVVALAILFLLTARQILK